jgi:serine/threonine-protein kinase PRP4
MASRRSRSPSTPSEGEIIESGSETKATTSQTSINGLNVDRRTRISASFSPRSPASAEGRSPRRHRSRSDSRSRSRSPYREYRGEKRRRGNDYDDRRYGHDSRRRGSRYDDRSYDSSHHSRRQRSYHDYDRIDSHSSNLHYNDDYETRREKRQRTRSRSPYRDSRHPKQYASGDSDRRSREPSKLRQDISGRKSSIEQSVSEWGNSPVVAQQNKQEAETRENQVQQDISDTTQSPLVEYVSIPTPFLSWISLLTY